MHHFQTHPFTALSNTLLHDILRLRSDVFIVEQNAPYADIDGLDPQALHICLLENETLIGITRIFPAGVKFPEASMGRIALKPEYRGQGLGRKLVTHALSEIQTHFQNPAILIEAQHDLEAFYQSLGFHPTSPPYDWAGVTYRKMHRPPQNKQ